MKTLIEQLKTEIETRTNENNFLVVFRMVFNVLKHYNFFPVRRYLKINNNYFLLT